MGNICSVFKEVKLNPPINDKSLSIIDPDDIVEEIPHKKGYTSNDF